jgi:hypothetical protein
MTVNPIPRPPRKLRSIAPTAGHSGALLVSLVCVSQANSDYPVAATVSSDCTQAQPHPLIIQVVSLGQGTMPRSWLRACMVNLQPDESLA